MWDCRNRLGIRLQGPRPKFARPDGGEGGSHPSNVHDHVYAIGTINFTGTADTPTYTVVYVYTQTVVDHKVVQKMQEVQNMQRVHEMVVQGTCQWR